MARFALGELLLVSCMLLFLVLLGIVAILVLARFVFGWGMRTCPHCAEHIQKDAVICRYCGRDVSPAASSAAAIPQSGEADSDD
ncbi:MAG TPA: hypothetical protein GX702_11785 [Chloroflexi bacterium]|jgi:predicted amidophosphoribosyltransferase|nr:hypothetical protein [Chloroflexota bacterium]